MAAFAGRSVAFTWNGSSISGIREKGISLAGEPIDITSDEDSGWRSLLTDVPSQNEVGISLSGVVKVDTLRAAWFSGARTKTVTLTYPDGGTLSGTFVLSSYNETGNYKDATTFDATLMSSGTVTYTPGS